MRPIIMTPEAIQEACNRLALQLQGQHTFKDKVDVSVPVNIKLTEEQKPTLFITLLAYQKLMALVQASTVEIAWHGTIERDVETNTFTLTDIFVFPQHVTGVTAVSIDELYGPWLMGLEEDVFNKLRLHGHSHVNMSVTPSGIDINYQESLIDRVQDFYIFIIVNKSAKCHATIFDVANNTVYTDDDITVDVAIDPVEVWAARQIKQQIDAHKPAPVTPSATNNLSTVTPNKIAPIVVDDLIISKSYEEGLFYNTFIGMWVPKKYQYYTTTGIDKALEDLNKKKTTAV